MQVSEIRNLLHLQVDQIQDEASLQLLEDVVQNLLGDSSAALPSKVVAGIKTGLADLAAGRVISEAEANAQADKWLAQ